jgi:hypothetical protein
MICAEFRLAVEDWLAGTLGGREGEFEAHRRRCAECNACAAETSRLAMILKRTGEAAAPSELWRRVQARLSIPARPAATRFGRFAMAACAAVALVIGLLLARPAPRPDLDQIYVAEISWGDEDGPADPLSKLLMGNHED